MHFKQFFFITFCDENNFFTTIFKNVTGFFYRSYLKKKTLLVHAYTWKVSSEWNKLTLNKLYILVIMTSPFYSRTLLYNTPPSPSLPIQVVNAISIFRNDKIVYLQSKGCMPTASWPPQSFSYLLSCDCFYCQSIQLILYIRAWEQIRGGRQFDMFMSENICTMVDLFDKAVAEGVR